MLPAAGLLGVQGLGRAQVDHASMRKRRRTARARLCGSDPSTLDHGYHPPRAALDLHLSRPQIAPMCLMGATREPSGPIRGSLSRRPGPPISTHPPDPLEGFDLRPGLSPRLTAATFLRIKESRCSPMPFRDKHHTFQGPELTPTGTLLAYATQQLPRIAWYVGHGLVMSRLAQRVRAIEGAGARPQPRSSAPVPDRKRLYEDMAVLFRRDLANVEHGIYPLPADRDGSVFTLLRRSGLFFEDLPRIHERRKADAHDEVFNEHTRGRRPRYYLQNFHFQTDGWMSSDSAERYDMQVEVLFNGTANAIRRQALPAIYEVLCRRDQRFCRLLDVGCGTGRFLDFVKQTWPRLPCIGLDLSEPYLTEARRHLKPRAWVKFIAGKAEQLPLTDESLDVVTNVFVMHELPPRVRRAVLKEFARVLKPKGRAILVTHYRPATSLSTMACWRFSLRTSMSLTTQAISQSPSPNWQAGADYGMCETNGHSSRRSWFSIR